MSIPNANIVQGPLILSDVKCLYCGKSSETFNYNCPCHPRPVWQNYYRSSTVKYFYSDKGKAHIRNSVQNYSFDHPQGMRQYASLPFPGEIFPENLITGLSPLQRLSNLSFRYGADLYVKNETYNPSHTTTDREILMCLLNSRKKKCNKAIFYGTAAGASSAASMAAKAGIKLIVVMDSRGAATKLDHIRSLGADVISLEDDNGLSGAFKLCAELNAKALFSDAGYDNWSAVNPFRMQGQKTTAVEIVKQLSRSSGKIEAPEVVIIPAVHGSSIIGLWRGFQELHDVGLISRLPRLVPVGLRYASPVTKAVKNMQINSPVHCDLRMLTDADWKINHDYILAEAFDSIEASRAVIESGGLAAEVGVDEIRRIKRYMAQDEEDLMRQDYSLQDYTAFLALAALERLQNNFNLQPWHKVVCILPGNPFQYPASAQTSSPDHYSEEEEEDSDVISAPVHVSGGKLINVSSGIQGLQQAFNELR